MKKKILHDYINSFRWNHFKKVFRKGIMIYFFWMIYMTLLPLFNGILKQNVWSYLIAMIYIFCVITNESVVPIYLPKQMFLTPMSKSERTHYMKGMLTLKILVPFVLGTFAIIVWAGLRNAPVWLAITNYIAGCSLVLGGTITSWPGSIWYRNDIANEKTELERIHDKRLKGLQALSTVDIILAICAYLVGMVFLEETDFEAGWVKIMAIIVVVLFAILNALILRYVRPVIEIATEYEKTYVVDKIFRAEG